MRTSGEHAGSSSSRRIVTTALMLGMAVAALEQTVVSTAMPTIIARLKGLDIYPWVFSAYLLASTVTAPLYGKLADLFGRKRVLLFGLALFSVGSMLSGCSQSMPMLIGMRVLQGLGAGSLGPIILTMIGDMYTLKERAKVQGVFSAIWGGASLIGPFLGGVLTDRLSWRWVFFVTVPFSLVSAWILVRHVREELKHKSIAPIDWAGAALLATGSTALLLAVLGGQGRSWELGACLIGLAVACLVLFVIQERRAPDPILPLDLIVQPTVAAAILGSFLIGGLLFGLDTYIPLYVQGVLGGSATQAGRTITPLFLAWSISVAIAAKVVLRLGFRATALVGSVLIASGSLVLASSARSTAWAMPVFFVAMIVMGLGMGPTAMCYLLDVQHSVPWNRRGVATGAMIFFRTVGAALCVGLLGASLGSSLGSRLAQAGAHDIDVAAALRPETHKQLSASQLRIVQDALGQSLQTVFFEIFALAALGIVCSSRLTHGHAVPPHEPAAEAEEADDLAVIALTET